MKFLIDTNILIPAEPTGPQDAESTTPIIAHLLGLIASAHFQCFIHPDSVTELSGDKNECRRTLRSQLVEKYVRLPSPPLVTNGMQAIIGQPQAGSHDYYDDRLLACVVGEAVDFLVTEDRKLHRKAERLGISERVIRPSEAAATIRGFIPNDAPASNIVRLTKCHSLNVADNIFCSLRDDYPGFDDWLVKCKRAHRDVFTIDSDLGLAAIAIIKDEEPSERGFRGSTLKICTFKVAEHARGMRYGELLLSAIFDYMESHRYEFTYCTCFPKQAALMELLRSVGFTVRGRDEDEIVLAKCVRPTPEEYDQFSPLDFNVRFGPLRVKANGADQYVIPIQPKYHRLLFPELDRQLSLFEGGTPYGNSILKAYLCRSPTKSLPPGSILLFYRSDDWASIRCVGVVEDTIRSRSKNEIMRFVGQRTVYSEAEIEGMCESGNKEVLAILFRQAKEVESVALSELCLQKVLKAVPQSITKVSLEGQLWLKPKIEA